MSNDKVVVDESAIVPFDIGDATSVLDSIVGQADLAIEVRDPDSVARELVYAIIAAQSDDEIAKLAETESAGDLLGVPVVIAGARFLPAKPGFVQEGGPRCFALIDAIDADGVKHKITSGSRNVLATVFNLRQRGALPTSRPWYFEARETASGFEAQWLLPVGEDQG